MEHVTMTGTDLCPSRICLGAVDFGTDICREDAFALMDAFLEAGGNFVDTAHVYADWLSDIKGMSERTIGEWMASRGCREQVIVGTKGGHMTAECPLPRLSPEQIHQDLTESLRRLQTEQIDLYWLHRDDPSLPVGQILDTLESERKAGLIRWYAASNWSTSRLREAAEYAQSRHIPGMAASQIRWSLADVNPDSISDRTMVEMDEQGWEFHRQTGLSVVPFSSQACGFFSGKYSQDRPDSGRPDVRKLYGTELNWRRLERVQELAAHTGYTPNQIALTYLMAQPFPVFPIVGARSIAQLNDSCDAVSIHLTSDQVDYLKNGASQKYHGRTH